MGIFRPEYKGIGRSPSREIYGEKNGYLVAPIDICIYEFSDDSVVRLNQVDSLGDLEGAAVRNTSGANIGTINNFEAPLVSTDFKPVVFIKLAEDVRLQTIIPRLPADPSEVSKGDDVSITIDGVLISGRVEKTIENFAYLKPDLQTQAYTVKFGQRLLDRAHGAAVVLNSSKLLGMLIITDDNKREGTTQALVYPAHLI